MSDPPAGGPTGGAGLPFALSGVIEGFYGPPWSWEVRAEVMAWCHQRGMGVYLYVPKDDPRHRERWREPYGPEELAGFDALVAADTLAVGFAISPGLSMDYAADDDRAALAAKVDQLVERGVSLVALLLDDIPVRPGLGPDHAELTTWLFEHLDGRADLVLTPTEYTGTLTDALPRGPGRGHAGRGAHRVDGHHGGLRPDHRGRGAGPRRRAGRSSALPVGQLPGQRRPDERPALHGPPPGP